MISQIQIADRLALYNELVTYGSQNRILTYATYLDSWLMVTGFP